MSDPGGRHTSYFSPEPHYRPTWAQHLGEGAVSPSSGSPGPGRQPPSSSGGAVRPGDGPPVPASIGQLLAVAVLSAVLASGGTYLFLASGGQIERPTRSPASLASATANASPPSQVTGDSAAIIAAAATVSPAVVTITSTTDFDPTTGNVPQVGVGSGVIFDSDGWILTNCHVVQGGSKLEVALKDGRTFDGSTYGIDTLTDLAIVRVAEDGLPAAPIGDSSTLQPGEQVIAVGSPLGTYTNSVTSGIVSALGRTIVAQGSVEGCNDVLRNLIQTDAAINLGNSGGALAAGARVVGINTAVATQAEGIGFAIPINIAKPIMEQALDGQPLARPFIGIRYVALDPQVARERNVSIDFGALINPAADGSEPGVVPGGPGDEAGLQDGDVITAIDGNRIDGSHPLDDLLAQHFPGDTVTLDVVRNGRTLTVTVTLGTRPAGV